MMIFLVSKQLFLNEAHNAKYVKSRYMRHLSQIFGSVIMSGTPVPWNEVSARNHLRGTRSNLADEDALRGEYFLRCVKTFVRSQQPAAYLFF